MLENAIGILNMPPSVDAGPVRSIQLSSSASLDGLANDDGILEPVSVTWTQEGGPGTAMFDDEFSIDTTVTFDQAGDYTLRLTATDGIATVFDETLVKVFPDNAPPVVDAGPDQTVTGTAVGFGGDTLQCSTTLTGAADDDGLPEPLSLTWSGGSFTNPADLIVEG